MNAPVRKSRLTLFVLSLPVIISAGLYLRYRETPVDSGFFEASGGGKPAFMQHALWLFGHPSVWISLVFYLSAALVWAYCIWQVFWQKSRKKRHVFGFFFYLCFFPLWVFYMFGRYRYFLGGT